MYMPNMSGHMAVAKRVSEILNINDPDYYRGNLLPDLYADKVKSHYKIPGRIYLIPDIAKVVDSIDLSNKKNIGILSHLLLDKHYFEEYMPSKYDRDIFNNGDKSIYKDYDILNKDIVEYFNIDVDYLTNILSEFDEDIELKKLDLNLKCLKINEDGKTTYLDKDDFIKFLSDISIVIAEEIKDYVRKSKR